MAVLDLTGREVDLALLGLAAGALWLGAVAFLYATRHPLEPQVGRRTLDLGPEPPALANLLVNDFQVTAEAVPATLIDLAARRVLEVEQRGPGVFFLRLRSHPSGELTAYERRVLDRLRALASDGVVPADALTTGQEDESSRWRGDFDREVVADAKARGLAHEATEGPMFFLLTVAGVLPAAPALVASAWGVAAVVVAAEIAILGWIRARFPLRETPEGLAAASRWLGVRAELAENEVFRTYSPLTVALWDRLLAFGAALGIATGASTPLPMRAESDTHAWSSHRGGWRPVRISYPRVWPPGWGAQPLSAVICGVVAAVAGGVALDWHGAELLDAAGDGWSGIWAAAMLAALGAAVLLGIAVTAMALPDLWTTVEVTGPILRLRAFGGEDARYYAAIDDGSSRTLRALRLSAEQHATLRQGRTVTVVATMNLGCVRSVEAVPD